VIKIGNSITGLGVHQETFFIFRLQYRLISSLICITKFNKVTFLTGTISFIGIVHLSERFSCNINFCFKMDQQYFHNISPFLINVMYWSHSQSSYRKLRNKAWILKVLSNFHNIFYVSFICNKYHYIFFYIFYLLALVRSPTEIHFE